MTKKIFVAFAIALFSTALNAGDVVPKKVQVALFSKIIGFNKNLSGDVTVYVMGDSEFAKLFKKKAEGKKSGKAKIKNVVSGDALPTNKPTIIYLGKDVSPADVLAYTAKEGVMSITGTPKFVAEGVSLGLKLQKGKPKILVGLKGTKAEGIKWNPTILKLGLKVK